MADKCAYKDGRRRCTRNGFGNPPLCRSHALHLSAIVGQAVDFPEGSPLFGLIDAADRVLSRSNSDLAKQVSGIFGEFLAGAANQRAAGRVPPPRRPPPPPPPPPPQAVPQDDPRVVLGFEPGDRLTKSLVKQRKKSLAALFHPDRPGGSESAMKRVNEAADKLLCSL